MNTTLEQPKSELSGVRPAPRNWRQDATRLGGVALAYLVAHKFAYFFPAAGQALMAVWPANGIALAALLLSPRSRWLALLTVILLTHFSIEMFAGRSLLGELGYVLANLVEIWGSAWLIVRWNAVPVSFSRVSAIVTLLGAALGVTAFSAVIGGASAAYQSGLPFALMYRSWWIADGLGLLVVTPVLVSWWRAKTEELTRWSWQRGVELGLVTALALGLDWAYFGPQRELLLIKPVSYMLVVPLAWVALRFGIRSTATLLAILAVFEVSVTAMGVGSFPLGGVDAAERLLLVQLFIGVKCAGTLLLASSFTERRLTEESLRSSEARLRALGDNLPDSMVYQAVRERDGSMRFVYVSAGIQRLIGLAAIEVLRDSGLYFQQMLEADRAAVAVAREKSLASMSVFDVVVRMRRVDGPVRWLHIRSQPVRLPDGRIAWDGLATDITVRREMEEALRASEEKFAKAFRSGPVALALTRLEDCQFMEVNAAMEKFLGYTREELLGNTSQTLSLWRTEAEHQQTLAEARAKRSVRDREMAFCAKSGELVYAQYAAEVIEVGGADCLLSVLVDITPQRRAQNELRRVNRALQTISHCNQALVRALSEAELLDQICQLIVTSGPEHTGGYKLAWVGFVQDDAVKPIRIVAVAGEQREHLERLRLSRPEPAHENGPTLTAVRTGQTVVIHDFLNDPRLADWRAAGQQRGFRSCISLPLRVEERVVGVLSIYSGEIDAFDPAEVKLLTEMADDLAYGIQSLRAHTRKEAAETEVRKLLREAEAAHAALQESRGALMEVNRRYARHETALSTLTRSYAQKPEELDEILHRITETVAVTMDVSRVGIWKYNATRTGLECLALFEFASGQHSQGATVARAGFESYFDALDNSDLIIAADACADPRTAVLAPYLQPLGIVSLLDVPFHARGAAAGVLSCEHCGTKRAWTPDEQTFIVAVANLVSMLFAQLEQQKLEVQLRQTQKLESLGTLAGGIAHDFNNILGAIISYTELSRQDHPNDSELQENLGEVLKASQRAVGLVRQILTFSRRQQQERKQVQLGPVVQEVLKLLRSTLPATIEIRAEIDPTLPPGTWQT
ncbi:MAG: GAF domain-containing protein [Verrucomicrobiota bacterium]